MGAVIPVTKKDGPPGSGRMTTDQAESDVGASSGRTYVWVADLLFPAAQCPPPLLATENRFAFGEFYSSHYFIMHFRCFDTRGPCGLWRDCPSLN